MRLLTCTGMLCLLTHNRTQHFLSHHSNGLFRRLTEFDLNARMTAEGAWVLIFLSLFWWKIKRIVFDRVPTLIASEMVKEGRVYRGPLGPRESTNR